MNAEESDVKEKELIDMKKGDIKKFVIGLGENPDEYKAEAEQLFEAGVTGAALLLVMEKRDEFVKELMKDFGFKNTL